MAEKKNSEKLRAEFRYYVLPENEKVLALLGKDWEREYGEGLNRLHFHNYYEIGICRSGKGKVVINDQVLDFCAGNIMAIPPNVLHTTNVDKGEKAFWEWLYFDLGAVVDDMLAEDNNKMNGRSILYQIYSTPLFITKDNCPVLAQLTDLLIREITDKGIMYRKNITDILNLLVVEIFRIGGG